MKPQISLVKFVNQILRLTWHKLYDRCILAIWICFDTHTFLEIAFWWMVLCNCFWLKAVFGWMLFLAESCSWLKAVFGWKLSLAESCIWLKAVFGWKRWEHPDLDCSMNSRSIKCPAVGSAGLGLFADLPGENRPGESAENWAED